MRSTGQACARRLRPRPLRMEDRESSAGTNECTAHAAKPAWRASPGSVQLAATIMRPRSASFMAART
jgi:hypothetical protein